MKLTFKHLYIFILFVCFATNSSGQSIQQKADSLLLLIENTTIDTVKAKHYIKLGKMYVYGEPNKAIQFLHKGLTIATETKFYDGLGKLYTSLFTVHDILGSHSDSLLTYVEAMENLYKKTGNINHKVRGHWNCGIYYRHFGNNDKVIKEYLKALKLVRQHKLPKIEEARLLGNIGTALEINGDYEEALKYYEQAAPLFKGDKVGQAVAYFNIGGLYNRRESAVDTALQMFNQAYTLAEEVKHYSLMAAILIRQGNCNDAKGNYERANELYQKALQLSEQYNIGENVKTIYASFSEHYLKRKQYKRSIEYSEKAIQLSENTKDYRFLSTLYQTQETAYIALGDYKKAYEAKTKLTNHLDSLNSTEVKGKIKELQTKYEVEQKEAENDLLKEKQEANLRKIRYRNYSTVALIFALLLAVGWVITYYRSNQLLRTNKAIIERQTNELQQLYENKNRFFVNIAHELRTPLMLIANPIENVIKNNHLSAQTAQSLQTVHRNTTYLKQLVNQILDLSKSERQKLPLQVSSFQLSELLNALIADFKPFADYQKISFQTPIHIDTILLKTDGEKLFIVLKNLLSNAFKYTPSGKEVALNYTEIGNEIIISIKDTGRGIATTDLQQIFKPYFQSQNLPIEGGTGIGLAICKTYIEELGGQINVNSELGKGSTFSIQFPKQLQHEKAENAMVALSFLQQTAIKTIDKTTKAKANDDAKTLLIVEDNLDICNYLQSILQDKYKIILANNGKEGLQQLEKQTPDLILTDLMMPVMNGFEFMKTVKQNEKWQQIPIIALTARSEMSDKLEALRIGIDDYLVKPFHEEELQIRIQNLLEYQNNRLTFIAEENEKAEVKSIQSDNQTEAVLTATITEIDQEWLKNVERLTAKNISNVDFNGYQLCLEMSISYSQLYRKTKLFTGFTPKQYINQIRYQQARQFLENRTYTSIKRVAYEVGFKDEKNFSRNFRKRFGKYPSAYLE